MTSECGGALHFRRWRRRAFAIAAAIGLLVLCVLVQMMNDANQCSTDRAAPHVEAPIGAMGSDGPPPAAQYK